MDPVEDGEHAGDFEDALDDRLGAEQEVEPTLARACATLVERRRQIVLESMNFVQLRSTIRCEQRTGTKLSDVEQAITDARLRSCGP